ncbi:class I histocompatibility antigen, F10 alpha chain-like [Eublepharis macularius]|uniref:Class I histocompatibility antigen, F10 alpha chain-like n=1 Tax=Eublepharis macularius TaxID=481883 RepID=A0AA97J8B0_EUBMA|nr:class I histocompatibility antigen, F10 alpha chain-like [Eublepharis macularius]
MGFLQWRLLLTGAILLMRLRGSWAGPSSHTMKFFKVSVSEPGHELPQFIIVGYLDNERFLRYDSNTRQMLPQAPWVRKVEEDNTDYWYWQTYFSQNVEQFFKDHLWKRHNHSKGFHTWQWTHGCELTQGGHKRGYNQFGYDGRDFLSLDKETLTWVAADASAQVTKRTWEAAPAIAAHEKYYLEVECIKWLQKFLAYGEEMLLRTERPTVKVARKEGYNGQETLICQAYGFYPQEIVISWTKDGEDQWQDTFHGGVAPNSDGTYHTWLSIEVDPKDRGRYRCQVGHSSLPEDLDLALEEPASNLGLIAGILGGVLAALILLGAGIAFHMKNYNRPEGGYKTPGTA